MGHIRRLIVFDLDGTLIDSRQDLADSANALIVERGGEPLPSHAIVAMVGEGAAVLVRRALAAARLADDPGSLSRFLELYDERLLRTTRVYAGIHDVLAELSPEGVIAVLTNKPIAPSRTLLDALGLTPLVETVIGGDGPFPRKPDPASMRHLIAHHGACADDTILIGDSRIDLETARAAGTHICLARYGFGYEQIRPVDLTGVEGVASEPGEIPAIVRRLLPNARPISP